MATKLAIEPGLRVIYPPEDDTDSWEPLADLVAVHGLGAHPDVTWITNEVHWLRDKDMLPKAVPQIRILRFAYESQWIGKDSIKQRLPLVADQLLQCLMRMRSACLTRPIIFLGHCFGGLVIEKALISAKLHFPDIIKASAGVILLGTPNRGSGSQSKAAVIANIASAMYQESDTHLLDTLAAETDVLKDLLYDFSLTINVQSIPLFCFFEQHRSDIAKVVRPKAWTFLSYEEVVVDESSACIDGFPKLGLSSDHFKLNKFGSSSDGNYEHVQFQIKKMVDEAVTRVNARFNPHTIIQSDAHFADQRDRDCVAALFVADSLDDMETIKTTKDQLMSSTGSWIIMDSVFTEWLNSESSSILLLRGEPGKGKTMLAISLVEELSKRIENEGSARSNTTLAYFFCDNKDDRRNNPVNIFRGLLHQILCQRPNLINHISDEYEKKKEQLFSSSSSLVALWRILHRMLKDPSMKHAYFIVDAVDECDSESLKVLLTLLETYLTESPGQIGAQGRQNAVKWLFTSRNDVRVMESLDGCHEICLESPSNQAQISRTVNAFIDLKAKYLARRKKYDSTTNTLVETKLREKSQNTFLWVSLACRELMDTPAVAAVDVLADLPSGLKPLYKRILLQITTNKHHRLSQAILDVLCTVAVAVRPLNLNELVVAADLPKGTHEESKAAESKAAEYVSQCASFLAIRDGIVHFVHQSAKDYLLSRDASSTLSSRLAEGNDLLAKRCLDYVCRLRLDLPAMESKTRPPHLAVRRHNPHLVEYPFIFWMVHARKASPKFASQLDSEIDMFNPSSATRQLWLDVYWPLLHKKADPQPNFFSHMHLLAFAGLAAMFERYSQQSALNTRDSEGNTPLHWGARNGHAQIVRLLLDRGADFRLKNNIEQVPLHVASENGHVEIAKLLIQRKADMNAKGYRDRTPLHRAAECGHGTLVYFLLLQGALTTSRDDFGATPLHRAVWSNNDEIVRTLISFGASVTVTNDFGATALHDAADQGRDNIAERLLRAGADPMALDDRQESALHGAAELGRLATVQLLVKSNSNIDLANSSGQTALHKSAANGHTSVVDHLVQGGARIGLKDMKGRTALYLAAAGSHEATVKLLVRYSSHAAYFDETDIRGLSILLQPTRAGCEGVLQILLDNGADPNMSSNDGLTALYEASVHGHAKIVDMLLMRGANVNFANSEGTTAVHAAAGNGHEEVVDILLKRGANINVRDENNSTPLHRAVANYKFNTIQQVLSAESVNAKDNLGRTPLYRAVDHIYQGSKNPKDFMTIHLLLQAGADLDVVATDGRTVAEIVESKHFVIEDHHLRQAEWPADFDPIDTLYSQSKRDKSR